MQAVGMHYRALRDLPAPGAIGVFAYREGDLVHESAVTGPGSWLRLGEDVEAVTGAGIEPPARNAPAHAWAAFLAATTPIGADELGAMGRDQMIAYHDQLTAEPAPSGSSSRRRTSPAAAGGGTEGDSS